MNIPATKRIQKELQDIIEEPDLQLNLVGDSMNKFAGQIYGPPGTPYEGGTYQLSFEIPSNYPFSPPKVKFITKVWHPNISSETGAICLEFLKGGTWSPSLTLRTVMLSFQALLSAPEPDDPQDAAVASQYKKDRENFNQTAQYWAHKYAGAPSRHDDSSYDDLVKKMLEMGFSDENSVNALSKNNFKLEAAVENLIENPNQ